MNRILIDRGFRLTIPEEVRSGLKEGDKMLVRVDRAGRIILLPEERIRATLQRTAGMWQDRADIPADGVE